MLHSDHVDLITSGMLVQLINHVQVRPTSGFDYGCHIVLRALVWWKDWQMKM